MADTQDRKGLSCRVVLMRSAPCSALARGLVVQGAAIGQPMARRVDDIRGRVERLEWRRIGCLMRPRHKGAGTPVRPAPRTGRVG